MSKKNLLVISNNFPNQDNTFVGDIFVKEQIKYLRYYFNNIYVVSPVAYGMEYLRKTKHYEYQFNNVRVFFPRYLNNPLFWYYARSMWTYLETRAVRSLIEKKHLNFDLIHAHFTWPSGAVGVELKKEFKVPVIITEHTHITLYKELKRKEKQYIKSWDLCDAIVRVNKKDIPLFINAGVSPNKMFHIGNGYDPQKFKRISMSEARIMLGLEAGKKIILSVGRLSEEKGQKYLIEAMKYVLVHRRDVLCFIGGSGPLNNKLRKLINELNLQNHVKLIGFIPDKLLPIWMNACDLFVLPSLNESFGIVQIEALACGKPIVAAINEGSTEIITSEDYGLLAKPMDYEDLSVKILRALDMGWDQDVILKYANQFTWPKIARQIVVIYKKYCKSGTVP